MPPGGDLAPPEERRLSIRAGRACACERGRPGSYEHLTEALDLLGNASACDAQGPPAVGPPYVRDRTRVQCHAAQNSAVTLHVCIPYELENDMADDKSKRG